MPQFTNDPIVSTSSSAEAPAVTGESQENEGVRGVSHNAHGAVVGVNDFAPAAPPGAGGNGGWFESTQGEGVRGLARSVHHGGVVGVNTAGGWGVYGQSDDGVGVVGESTKGEGLRGVSHHSHGAVVGVNDWAPDSPPGAGGNGAWFESARGEGVRGQANNPHHGGVVGVNTAGGIAVFGQSSGTAGYFEGNVEVTGDLVLVGADYAEAFMTAVEVELEPGMIAVVDDDGRMRPCDSDYDPRVAGIVSGARGTRPAIVLDRKEGAVPIAMMGAVWCLADATEAPIRPGALLTTSSNPGHARAATDRSRAFGAVVGKALTPLPAGVGYVRVLVSPR